MVNKCECEGCRRERADAPGYQPCERDRLSPPPTVEFIGGHSGGVSAYLYFLPLILFIFSVGIVVGKYWL